MKQKKKTERRKRRGSGLTMATADSGAKPLQNAMKMAKLAIQLDGENKHKEAYCEYLRTINFISHALLEEAGSQNDGEVVAVEVGRMLRLAEQCLERVKSFIGKRADLSASGSAPFSSSPGQSEPNQTAVLTDTTANPVTAPSSDTPVDTGHKTTSPTKTGHYRVLSDGTGELSSFLPPEVFQRLQTVQSQDISKKELTPIEEASRLNQKLKANYEARLARLPPGKAYQKTSLTLSLQRQMMENLIIAKARQDALQRKMEERRLRLQEEANRCDRPLYRPGVLCLPTRRAVRDGAHPQPGDFQHLGQRNKSSAFSIPMYWNMSRTIRADHPVVNLLRKHQYRVYNRLYPIVSKGLVQSPPRPLTPSRSTHLLHPEKKTTRGSSVGGQSFSTATSLSPSLSHDHSTNDEDEVEEELHSQVTVDRENSFEDLEQFLTQLDWAPLHSSTEDSEGTCDPSLQPEQDEGSLQELEMRALTEHLKAVVKDIHIAIDQLLSLCLLSFECLNTANSKDLCLASIEEAFFTPLWSALVALFRRVYREREQAFEMSMKLYQDVSPGDVGVPSKLFPEDSDAQQGSYPYESAVQELKLLLKDCCPQRKLECIVRTLRLICACAEDYRCLHDVDSTPKTAAIGADDLLPILSFVALRCQCPQLVSECAALEEFIHEGYLIGEEGYCLTSMQSALAYVESLQPGQLPAHKLV
ncbi:VPS9 domain-containing protein 1 isoform X2 [Gymnodraco acuticeps]|uniref:VPS9 domain-containing protein 1 isoform X2 n=1 Tax=Gymnodraco acuticeps TaxID=8218 RepID=A0A6P8V0J9_GYMAC|nr:VPS9 domain-containing protein 1 isoform X2 [Gymnodraco acuticeps]